VPCYEAVTALPFPHLARATAGLRAMLHSQLIDGELPDWSTLVVTGPEEVTDARGRPWFEYRAEMTTP
jgi:hypothetical protein